MSSARLNLAQGLYKKNTRSRALLLRHYLSGDFVYLCFHVCLRRGGRGDGLIVTAISSPGRLIEIWVPAFSHGSENAQYFQTANSAKNIPLD